MLALPLVTAIAARAQAPTSSALPPLTFLGLQAGTPVSELAAQVRLLGGGLACRPARTDARVLDCQGTVLDPTQSPPTRLGIWLSAMDSLVGVMSVSGRVTPEQLALWREALERAFGPGTDTRGEQGMLQWIRRRQMLRLTWRGHAARTEASVSLVDGPILDGWGRSREATASDEGLP